LILALVEIEDSMKSSTQFY